MARILFLTQVLPYPLDAGPKTRAYYVLRHLAQQHEVTLLSFIRTDDNPAYFEVLQALCVEVRTVPMVRSLRQTLWAVARALPSGRPTVILRDEQPAMKQEIKRLIATHRFDVIHADQTSMVQYALYAWQVARDHDAEPRLVVDAHNALFRVFQRLATFERNPFRRWFLQREAHALAPYEHASYRAFDEIVFVSEEDQAAFNIGGTVIPICVDPTERPMIDREATARTILHLGTMFWPPNVEGVLWFAREVYSLIKQAVPDARFVIIGKQPPPSIQALATQQPGVEVLGYVADPTSYLAQTAVFIVPLHAGGGMRVKIVDAWCWGVPLVSTSLGIEGIKRREGENVLVGNSATDFARAVIDLLENPEAGRHLAINGRQWVMRHYDWHTIYPQWDRVYQRLMSTTTDHM